MEQDYQYFIKNYYSKLLMVQFSIKFRKFLKLNQLLMEIIIIQLDNIK